MLKWFLGAALAVTSFNSVMAQTPSQNVQFRIGTGGNSGIYHKVFVELKTRVPKGAEFIEVPSSGSLDNIRCLMEDRCGVILTQSDVFSVALLENPNYQERAIVGHDLYDEFVHMICPTSMNITNVSQISSIPKVKIIAGGESTGTFRTWNNMRNIDHPIKDVPRSADAPGYNSATLMRSANNVSCMVMVVGLRSAEMRSIDGASVVGNKPQSLRLMNWDIPSIFSLKAYDGKPYYGTSTIYRKKGKEGFYLNLLPEDGMFSTGAVTMPTVTALMVFSKKFRDSLSPEMLKQFNLAVDESIPSIQQIVTQ